VHKRKIRIKTTIDSRPQSQFLFKKLPNLLAIST